MKRRFTKYPQGHILANSDTNRYMRDLSEYLDYLSDDEIDAIDVETRSTYEPYAWIIVPDFLREEVENAVGIEYCSPSENYYYYIEYHPDDDSIFFGIDTDKNMESLEISKQTEDRFKTKFKRAIQSANY